MSLAAQYDKFAKLLHHLPDLMAFQNGCLWPPHVVFHVTAACNLNCHHCTYLNRDKSLSIPYDDVEWLAHVLAEHGTGAIEHSGGEPTVYPRILDVVKLVRRLGMRQGLLTNGLKLNEALGEEGIEQCDWIRVSLDGFTQGVDVPHVKGNAATKITASYVWGIESTPTHLDQVERWCEAQGVRCRVIPDVWLPFRGPQRDDARKACEGRGPLIGFLDRDDERQPPAGCYSAWWKPMVAWDGWVYPCCYGTTYEWNRDVPPAYRLCELRDFERFFTEEAIRDLGHRCSNCLGWEQNNLMHAALTPVEDVEFL